MAPGRNAWDFYSNDLAHWFKHARPLHLPRRAIEAEISGLKDERKYLSLARTICRKAAMGDAGTEVKVRERRSADRWIIDYLVWYEPPNTVRGLFLVVNDCGDHGELETMFVPHDGRSYFDGQSGAYLH